MHAKHRWLGIFRASALLIFIGILPPPNLRADALDQWTTNQFTGFARSSDYGYQVQGVAYGNGRFVAVGRYAGSDFGFIESSEDGVTWTKQRDGDFGGSTVLVLEDVTFGNGMFVAVGWDFYNSSGNLYSSTNGIDWQSRTNATVSNFYGVTYGGGRFVAVGDGWVPGTFIFTNANIYTSEDGMNWTVRNSGSPANDVHTIYDVAYGPGRFVAVGEGGFVYTSTFGNTWTRSHPGGGSTVSYANGLFIIPFGPGTNLVSSDGLSWTTLTNNTASWFGRVIYGNGLFLALSSTYLFTSTDGTNWVQRGISATGMVDVVFGPRRGVAVGSSPYIPATGYDALTFASDPFVAVSAGSGFPPSLNLSGLTNHSYRIEWQTNLAETNWLPLTTLPLTNSPTTWTDADATNAQRFYRAALLP